MDALISYVPYCGIAPGPGELWARWNLDPWLIGTLAALLLVHAARLRTTSDAGRTLGGAARVWFVAGWSALTFALVSPLCALSVALFSARVAQHMWIAMVAAPLLVLAGARLHLLRIKLNPLTAAGFFAIALWAWHLPRLYDATFGSDLAYWSMHLSIGLASVWLWSGLLHADREQWLARLAAGFLTLVHMGLLGALITFAPRTLYQSHLLTSDVWGLTALEDQQLGGLIMWVPAGVTLLLGALAVLYAVLGREESDKSAPAAG